MAEEIVQEYSTDNWVFSVHIWSEECVTGGYSGF